MVQKKGTSTLNLGQTASVYARIKDSGGTVVVAQNGGDSIPIDIMATTRMAQQ